MNVLLRNMEGMECLQLTMNDLASEVEKFGEGRSNAKVFFITSTR